VREVIVWETVHNALWQTLEEEAFNSVRDRLFSSLEKKYDRLRKQRHPQDETLFVVPLYVFEGTTRHEFEFHVDDTTADTHLLVLAVAHRAEIIG
jgi:hypothetical protein